MKAAPRAMLALEQLEVAGGVERFVCDLATHLAGQGWDVVVATAAPVPAVPPYALPATVRLRAGRRPLATGDGAGAVLRRQWRVGRALGRIARSEQPDVLLLNGLTTACSVLALDGVGGFGRLGDLGGGGLARRTVCCDHNHFDARSRPWRGLRARLYRDVAAVVSLTQADAPRFGALNPCTEVIYNASALQLPPGGTPAMPPAPTVLAVARHAAQKGLDLLLQAWATVQQALPQARLRIVGDGPLRGALQAQAQGLGLQATVEWHPPTRDMPAQYAQSAVFVLPSRYEGMPLALLEAQALGVPAVAFDCPTGPREIVTPDTGIVVPPGNIAALADALLRLLRDPTLRARMAQAAVARSRAHFSPEAHRQQWTRLLQRVAGQGAAGVPDTGTGTSMDT